MAGVAPDERAILAVDELRTGAVFGAAWKAVNGLVAMRRRWTVTQADPGAGVLDVDVPAWLGRTIARLRIHLTLDGVGMTRIQVSWIGSPGRAPDWLCARELGRFRRDLGRSLGEERAS